MEVYISKIRRVWLFYVVVSQRTAKKCKSIHNAHLKSLIKEKKNQEINIFCQILVTYGYRLPLGVAVFFCDENTSLPLISHSPMRSILYKVFVVFSGEARYSYIKLITIITVPGSIKEFIVWTIGKKASCNLDWTIGPSRWSSDTPCRSMPPHLAWRHLFGIKLAR